MFKNYSRYADCIKKYYDGRDSSHGWNHVEAVCKNALTICMRENITNEKQLKIVMIASLGHDIWDHKYIGEGEEINIKESFGCDLTNLGFLAADIDLIIRIIDCISFSKEYLLRNEGGEFDLEKPEELLRNIVSDSDKLEALGEICIKRMIEYEIQRNKSQIQVQDHIKHIRKHCKEKLYILIDEGYIKTKTGLQLAYPLMNEMKRIVDDDTQLFKFIDNYLKNR